MGKIIRNGIEYRGGSGSTTTRFVQDTADENYGWIQYKDENGNWVNWVQAETSTYPLYMSSANEGNFVAYAGSISSNATLQTPKVTFGDALTATVTGTVEHTFNNGCVITAPIDLSNFDRLTFDYTANGNCYSSSATGTLLITQSKEELIVAAASQQFHDAYNDGTTSEGTIIVDISSLNGEYYIGIMVATYGISSTSISISNMYMYAI